MNNKIMEAIETIEERIERIKWMIPIPFSLKKAGTPDTINLIRKTAGILGKDSPKGSVFENKIRREWRADFLKRIS